MKYYTMSWNIFARQNLTRSILIEGPPEVTKQFIFEAAIHWVEEGHRVIYITPAPLESLPAIYHDRNDLSPAAFKLVRFMYLENYETLVDSLIDLHNFQVLPSVLLIDDLDTYIKDPVGRRQPEVHVARLLALIKDTTDACSRILKRRVHLCISASTIKHPHLAYFQDTWLASSQTTSEDGRRVSLLRTRKDGVEEEGETNPVFRYDKFDDGTLVLEQTGETFLSGG